MINDLANGKCDKLRKGKSKNKALEKKHAPVQLQKRALRNEGEEGGTGQW